MLPYYEKRSADIFAFSSQQWHQEEPGWPIHLHHQLELVYVSEGCVDVTVDNCTRRLQAGDVALVFPHCIHGYKLVNDQKTPSLMLGLMIAPHLAGDFEERLTRKLPTEPFVAAEDLPKDALSALQQLIFSHNRLHIAVFKAYLQLLLALIWPQLQPVSDHRQRYDDTPHRVIQYVLDHADQPLQATDVAAALDISPSHLARVFAQHLHMGFNQYLNQLRIQAAENRLRSTDRPITDIMVEVGFDSQSTFNRAFRRVHGISPREYRRQMHPGQDADQNDTRKE